MVAPTKISTANHYACVIQKIQTEYLHMHYTNYLTAEKKKRKTPFTKQDTLF